MTTREGRFYCEYVDLSLRPAEDMLYKCVQEPQKGYDFYCAGDTSVADRKNTSYTDNSGILRGYATSGQHDKYGPIQPDLSAPASDLMRNSQPGKQPIKQPFQKGGSSFGQTEGFSNMFITDNGPGESKIKEPCPQGYTRCPKTGRCFQVCVGCSYKDNMRSKEFNEADPCFPEGVYDGVDKYGNIICTCGSNNTYCSQAFTNQFTADGNMFYNNKIKNTLGITDSISKLFDFSSL